MIFPSLINWVALAVMLAVFWRVHPRRRGAWLGAASIALVALNDFLAAVFVMYLVGLCLLAHKIFACGTAGETGNGVETKGGAKIVEPVKPHAVRKIRLWALLIPALMPLVLLKYPGLLGINALQENGLLKVDFSALAVPIGISYLTFKAVMYIVDCGRDTLPDLSFSALAVYIVFAPTVTSGPIDQPAGFIGQLLNPGRLDFERVIYATYRIATGVIFKFVIADTLSEASDAFQAINLSLSHTKLLLFGPYYSLWLYFDFAGYSHIAIGVAYLFGIKCMENFAAPLLKPNISEFWRTWHVSLTTFLRNYIFLPNAFRWSRTLGARRASFAATILAFVVCGAWHGDGVNFLLWGLYHGVLLSLHQAFLHNTRKNKLFKSLRAQRWLVVPSWALTFALLCVGWFPFAFTWRELKGIFFG